jgi:predicted NodU family carbamoyl transferase
MRIAIEKCDKARRRMVKRMKNRRQKRRQKRRIKRRTKSRKKKENGESDTTPHHAAHSQRHQGYYQLSPFCPTQRVSHSIISVHWKWPSTTSIIKKKKPSHPLITTPAHSTLLSGFSSDYSAYGETQSLSP